MDSGARRAAAICTQCDNVIAVQILADDTVQPIGIDGECSCGNETYQILSDEPTSTDEHEDSRSTNEQG